MLDGHAMQMKAAAPAKKPRAKPIDNIWDSLHLDVHLSERAVGMRKATGKMMEDNYKEITKHVGDTSFPEWIKEKIRALGVNGLQIKDFGGPGLSTLEAGAICYEMAKLDGSIATFFLVHNAIGMMVVEALGDDEQRERILTPAIKLDKILCFGLTEPLNGSDATGLTTNAVKVPGGYKINGQKRWIGNAVGGDVLVWAKNVDDGNRIQAFLVEQGMPGFTATKIEGKYSLRVV